MKKLIILCLMCISLTHSHAQDNYWYVNGEKRYFEISSHKVLVKVDEKMAENPARYLAVETGADFSVRSAVKKNHHHFSKIEKMINFVFQFQLKKT